MSESVSRIEMDPNKLGGKPIIKGTRIPVSTILANLEQGMSILDITEEFDGIDEEDVKAVIRFARLLISEEISLGSSS
ncbi:MAG: DUF433 domain-containing protein [Candidatus Heimdallarchaeota archaeon]|nr:DUF433 domain-containing protein [Candidatus Heimdallarchaeota archaeon]